MCACVYVVVCADNGVKREPRRKDILWGLTCNWCVQFMHAGVAVYMFYVCCSTVIPKTCMHECN